VLIRSYDNIALLSPETGKIAIVIVENYENDFDIVRGTLVCVSTAFNGSVRLFVAKLSRIFEHTQGTPEPILLSEICEICLVPPFIQTTPHSKRYALTVCDPMIWGSARPCRILLTNVDKFGYEDQGNKLVRVHRLYLEGSHNSSDFALTYDSESNCVPLGRSPAYTYAAVDIRPLDVF